MGDKNENFFLVNQGVKEGDVLMLSAPENVNNLSFEGMDLYYKIMERKAKEKEEANKALEEDKNKTALLNTHSSQNQDNPLFACRDEHREQTRHASSYFPPHQQD